LWAFTPWCYTRYVSKNTTPVSVYSRSEKPGYAHHHHHHHHHHSLLIRIHESMKTTKTNTEREKEKKEKTDRTLHPLFCIVVALYD